MDPSPSPSPLSTNNDEQSSIISEQIELNGDAARQAASLPALSQIQMLQRMNVERSGNFLSPSPTIVAMAGSSISGNGTINPTFRPPAGINNNMSTSMNVNTAITTAPTGALSVPLPTMTRSSIPLTTAFSPSSYVRASPGASSLHQTVQASFGIGPSSTPSLMNLARPLSTTSTTTTTGTRSGSIVPGLEGTAPKPPPAEVIAAIRGRLATVPPYDTQMDEVAFRQSLMQFMQVVNCPIKKMPMIRPDRPLPMLKLFQIVTTFGGFRAVSEAKRWPAVAVSLEIHPFAPETITSLQKLYASMLFAYEQVYFLKLPLERIIWPQQIIHSLNLQEQQQRATTVSRGEAAGTMAVLPTATMANEVVEKVERNKPTPIESTETSESSKTSTIPSTTTKPQTISKTNAETKKVPSTSTLDMPLHYQGEIKNSPIVEIYRMTRRAKKAFQSCLSTGKLAIEEVILILGSGNELLEAMILPILERCQWEQAHFADEATFQRLINILVSLGFKIVQRLPPCEENITLSSPFNFLLRVSEAKMQNLDLPYLMAQYDSKLLTCLVTILKKLALTYKEGFPFQRSLANNKFFLQDWLLPLITDRRIWSLLTWETYNEAWLTLQALIPFCTQVEGSFLKNIIFIITKEICQGTRQSMQWAHILCPLSLQNDNLEDNHRKLSRFLSLLPLRLFFMMDCLMKFFLNVQLLEPLLGDHDRLEPDNAAYSSTLDCFINLISLLELLLPIYPTFVKNSIEVITASPVDSIAYAINIGKFLHNPHCCLTDGGYLELILQNIMILLRRLEPKSVEPYQSKLISLNLLIARCTRRLYLLPLPVQTPPRPLPYLVMIEGQQRSILKQQPILATFSNPLRIYQLACLLLNSITKDIEISELAPLLVNEVIQLLTEELASIHHDLLSSPDLEAFINRLL